MSKLLIDADILLYRAASSVEREIEWEEDIFTLYADLNEAKTAFKVQLQRIQDKLKSDDVLCCLTSRSGNFRKQVSPTYKSNRKGTRKPVGYVALCDWVSDTYDSITKPNLEADDVMGILQTKPENIGKTIIVSDDKDMKTIPGKLYRPTADEMLDVTEADAEAFFLQQCLQGDQVDGIPGLKGCGEKTAKKILGIRPSWGAVEQAYVKAGYTKDDAIQQARLVRILHWSDVDSKGEPILWTPNT